jgi:hypothetical protein
MYLTNSYLCFFAHMPTREVRRPNLRGSTQLPCSSHFPLFLQDQVLKSGSLSKKAQRTKRWIKHWFVLKNDALSWYQSSSVSFFLYLHMPANTMSLRTPTFPMGLRICVTQYLVMRKARRGSVCGQIRRTYIFWPTLFPAERSGSRLFERSFSRRRT